MVGFLGSGCERRMWDGEKREWDFGSWREGTGRMERDEEKGFGFRHMRDVGK